MRDHGNEHGEKRNGEPNEGLLAGEIVTDGIDGGDAEDGEEDRGEEREPSIGRLCE